MDLSAMKIYFTNDKLGTGFSIENGNYLSRFAL